jgi:lipid-A-disaccharide synthase-like uncharacterized protein
MNVTLTKKEKTDRVIYWIATGILGLFLLSGIFFMNSKMAIDGMHHLGVPEWFRWELSIGHIIGGILLLVPINSRIKEWNYVALGIDCLSAMIAYLSVDGAVANSFSPLVNFGILVVSYIFYHRIKRK